MLLGPSVGSSIPGVTWTPEQVWETGWLDTFKDRLYGVTVEQFVELFFFDLVLKKNFPHFLSATRITIVWPRLAEMVLSLPLFLKKR